MAPTRILVIRRDNIGDLICTTPLIRALRQQLPSAWIAVLVNRYNEPVLTGNPDINQIYAYQKAKHRGDEETLLGIYWQRLKMLAELRRQRFDWVLLPGGAQKSALRFARFVAPARILTRIPEDAAAGAHEVEQTCHLLTRMGLHYEAPKERIVANQEIISSTVAQVRSHLGWMPSRIIGIHISARKPSQRWPAERFVELIRNFPATPGTAFLLLWAPGSASDPKHPGDDEKAADIRSQLTAYPVVPVSTKKLEELIGALALCDNVICADGGAMHIAAALGKAIVCLFGHSSADQWRPWGVPYVLLQKNSHQVADISVAEVLESLENLMPAQCQ